MQAATRLASPLRQQINPTPLTVLVAKVLATENLIHEETDTDANQAQLPTRIEFAPLSQPKLAASAVSSLLNIF